MTILKVNAIQNTSGTSYLPSTGTIIQSVQYEYRDVFENSAVNSEYDLPSPLGDGSASITPLNSSSRILFSSVIHGGLETTWRNNFFKCFYITGSGSWTQFTAFAHYTWVTTNGLMNSVGTEFLLTSLSTTSAVAFKITQIGHANGGALHLNQNNFTDSTSANNTTKCSSTITLSEISA